MSEVPALTRKENKTEGRLITGGHHEMGGDALDYRLKPEHHAAVGLGGKQHLGDWDGSLAVQLVVQPSVLRLHEAVSY
jgi:hypothetical protein